MFDILFFAIFCNGDSHNLKMTSPPAVGKRRSLTMLPTTEDQQLNLIAQEVIILCFSSVVNKMFQIIFVHKESNQVCFCHVSTLQSKQELVSGLLLKMNSGLWIKFSALIAPNVAAISFICYRYVEASNSSFDFGWILN
jgi:hypothetical protein